MNRALKQVIETPIDSNFEQVVQDHFVESNDVMRFMSHYIEWNRLFGAGVTNLASKLTIYGDFKNHRDFYTSDPYDPYADMENTIGAHIFYAAIDEYGAEHGVTHRKLAQALLKGLEEELGIQHVTTPEWLHENNKGTLLGYCVENPNSKVSFPTLENLFFGLGFHLGSERFADAEFSAIEKAFQNQLPNLTETLKKKKVSMNGKQLPCFLWVSIHSSLNEESGDAEDRHFQMAVTGVQKAFEYAPPKEQPFLEQALLDGFDHFVKCHERFFKNVHRKE